MPKPVLLGPQLAKRIQKKTARLDGPAKTNLSKQYHLPTGIKAKTPSGGIPAATIVGDDIEYGSATCLLVHDYLNNDGELNGKVTELEVLVYNSSPLDISGSSIIQAKLHSNLYYFVDVDVC